MFLQFVKPFCAITIAVGLSFFIQGCLKEDDETVPVVLTTNAITSVTRHTAEGGGEIKTGSGITERGVCWSTHEGATVDDHKMASGEGTGIFTVSLNGLTEGTHYFARAYAVTSRGTEYGNEVAIDTQPADVFISATVRFDGGSFVTESPVYWKNGTFTQLPCGSSGSSWALDIFVADNQDVYISGSDGTSAVYWKNGTEMPLAAPGMVFAYAYNIAVTKTNDIFFSGRAATKFGVMSDAIYWQNGGLHTVWKNGSATSVSVSGNDVYTMGGQYADELGNAPYVQRVDKNGSNYILPDGVPAGGGRIFVAENGDVYIPGAKTGQGGKDIAKFWKNGTSVLVSDGTKNAGGSAVFVSGNDIYVAGYEESASIGTTAKYWKNGAGVTLSAGGVRCIATQIFVSGDNVYVLGVTIRDDGGNNPILWKNGSIVAPFDGTQLDVFNPSLAVYDK